MKIIMNKNKEGGYAILFTVVVVGIISMITIGLSNSAYKQTILSAVARDSTTAFYQADIGSECAMYVDAKFKDTDMNNLVEPGWTCGGKKISFDIPVESTDADSNKQYKYLLTLDNTAEKDSKKCFRLEIIKTENKIDGEMNTEINSRGYNICNTGNMRTVERALKVTY